MTTATYLSLTEAQKDVVRAACEALDANVKAGAITSEMAGDHLMAVVYAMAAQNAK